MRTLDLAAMCEYGRDRSFIAVRMKRNATSLVRDSDVDLRRIPAGARHARTLQFVDGNGFILVSEVAERLAVSEMTIRRDLWALEDKGLIVRTHGGAIGIGRREIF